LSKIEVNAIEPQCGTNLTVGASGDTITFPSGTTVVNNGSQTGFGRTGTVDWQTGSIKTATFTAANGEGYFANTSGGAFTMNLPAGTAGNIVSVVDYTNTFQTNSLTIAANGSQKIGGVASPQTLSTEGQSVTFVYVDDTEGWKNVQDSTSNVIGNAFIAATGGTITTCGNCKIHTFTGPGTFCVSKTACVSANNEVSYLVVAGGGGGGRVCAGGGGGAGGFREDKSPITPYTASPLDGAGPITVTATAFPITVGGGGAGSSPGCSTIAGTSGANSVFSTIISTGGGGGGAPGPIANGSPGGSGGGGAHSAGTGGSGNTPPVSPPQGNNGAASVPGAGSAPSDAAGGGGGATSGASNCGAPGPTGHAGGAGATTSITGSSVAYAGGGGGVNRCGGGANDTDGGIGGGGKGGYGARPTPLCQSEGQNGTTNTGGGGGGGKRLGTPVLSGGGGTGGSGIVIIRYKYQ
jgi:hypothetical protein